jgi:hypothetical protein
MKEEELEHVYTSEQKIDWFGYGEWVEEPDVYIFTYKGCNCSVKRIVVQYELDYVFGGHLCGYVQIPKDHPYYEKGYDDINIDCHGGFTYSEVMGTDNEHWIGFDCMHSYDYCPSMEKFCREVRELEELFPGKFKDNPLFSLTYRNFQFCIDQCKSIVDQLIEISIKVS